MPNPNLSPQCRGCGAEDCCCCGVWLEHQADMRASLSEDPRDLEDDFRDEYNEDYFDDDDLDESMDGDFDSGMASAGFGTDEDYGYYGGEDCDMGSFED